MRKAKGLPPNYKLSKLYKKYVPFKNTHTDGYRPLFKWYRSDLKTCNFKYKHHYKFRLINSSWKIVSKALFKEPSLIYKYHDG